MVTDTIFGSWSRPGWLQVLSEYVPSSPTNNSKIKGGEDTRGHIMGYGGESYYYHDDDYYNLNCIVVVRSEPEFLEVGALTPSRSPSQAPSRLDSARPGDSEARSSSLVHHDASDHVCPELPAAMA